MSSHSKLNPNTKKKADIDTTLSAKLMGKSKGNQQQKPKISAFKLEDSSQSCTLAAGQSRELKAIKDINHQYIELFHNIFKDNRQLLKLFYMNSEVLTNPVAKLTKEQRYQLECMKLFQSTSDQIEKMNQIKHTNQQWKLLVNYIKSKAQKQGEISKQQCLKMGRNLISNYKQTNDHLKEVEKQHENLLQKHFGNSEYLENKEDHYLTKIEMSYKKSQKKLNKVITQQQYYQQKCISQQRLLQKLQHKIRKTEQAKLNIEMKIISEKSRNDRLVRKQREKEQKSFAHSRQKQTYFKATRSKSSTRINPSQLYSLHDKNRHELTPAKKFNYF